MYYIIIDWRHTMKKKVWLFLFAILVALPLNAKAKETLAGPIPAKVLRVIDGDTIVLRAHVWLGQTIETIVRIRGIDTPEMKGKCEFERQKAEEAKIFLEKMTNGKDIFLANVSYDKYGGRVVAAIKTKDDKDLSAEMINKGLAREYQGKTKQGWCKNQTDKPDKPKKTAK